jgi:hypothetical protein
MPQRFDGICAKSPMTRVPALYALFVRSRMALRPMPEFGSRTVDESTPMKSWPLRFAIKPESVAEGSVR